MTSSMKIDCNAWQKGLRDQDPATKAPPEYYKKETLRRFRNWLKVEFPTARLFVKHSEWRDILSDVGRGKKNTIEGFYAHMMVALKKLLLFHSVKDQIDREGIVDTTSPQYKDLHASQKLPQYSRSRHRLYSECYQRGKD